MCMFSGKNALAGVSECKLVIGVGSAEFDGNRVPSVDSTTETGTSAAGKQRDKKYNGECSGRDARCQLRPAIEKDLNDGNDCGTQETDLNCAPDRGEH